MLLTTLSMSFMSSLQLVPGGCTLRHPYDLSSSGRKKGGKNCDSIRSVAEKVLSVLLANHHQQTVH